MPAPHPSPSIPLARSKEEFTPGGLAGKGISLMWFWVCEEGGQSPVPQGAGPSVPAGTCELHPPFQTHIPGAEGDACRGAGRDGAA